MTTLTPIQVESVLMMGSKKVAEGRQHIAEYIEEQNASACKKEKQTGKVRIKIPCRASLFMLQGPCSSPFDLLMQKQNVID